MCGAALSVRGKKTHPQARTVSGRREEKKNRRGDGPDQIRAELDRVGPRTKKAEAL